MAVSDAASPVAVCTGLGLFVEGWQGELENGQPVSARQNGERAEPKDWNRAARNALWAFVAGQPGKVRERINALARAVEHARRLLQRDSPSREKARVPKRANTSRAKAPRRPRQTRRLRPSRDGPEPPGTAAERPSLEASS